MPEVPAIRRTLTDAEIIDAFDRAAPPFSTQQRAHALALIVLETGRRPTQFNLGNTIVPTSQQDDPEVLFWRPPWFDEPGPDASGRDIRLHEKMLRGEAPSAFRAYPDLATGMRAYLRTLQSARFAPMLAARGPRQWLVAQRDTGYSPDLDIDATLRNFVKLTRHFGGELDPVTTDGRLGPFDATAEAVAFTGAALGFFAWLASRK